MKIGIYGGTFDPPHLGHMEAARAAAERLGLDRILFVPAAIPPHKELPPETVSPEDRLAMAALTADGLCLEEGRPGLARAEGLELEREGKSYTADTVAELRRRFPEDELWLLVGTDMFLSLQDWREPKRIMDQVGIAAFARRESDQGAPLEAQGRFLRETFGARVDIVPLSQVIDLSSTQVRALLREDRARAREEHASLKEIRGEDTPPLEMNLKGTLSGNGRTVTMLWEDYMYLGGAHGGLVLSSQTYALPDGRPVGLNDLFPNTGKALHLISVLSRKDLLARGLPQDMVMAGTMPEEDNFSTFLLEKDGITFYFSPYQVASWADGVITVTLKLKDLAGAAPHRQYWK